MAQPARDVEQRDPGVGLGRHRLRGSQVPYQGGRPNFRFTLDPLPDGTLKWTHGEGGGAALS